MTIQRYAVKARALWSAGTYLEMPVAYVEGQRITGVTGTTSKGEVYRQFEEGSAAALLEPDVSTDGLAGNGWTIYDVPDDTLLPGLIDGHVHTVMPGTGADMLEAMASDHDQLLLRAAANSARALDYGVTTVVDVGGPIDVVFPLREAIETGTFIGSRVIPAGPPITITGGHCWPWGGEADTLDEVVRRVRLHVKAGAQFIKVMGTGGGTPGTNSFVPQFPQEVMIAIVREARRTGRIVAVHCSSTEAIRIAANAGVNVIFHAHFHRPDGVLEYDPEVARLLVEKGVAVDPTLWVNEVVLGRIRERLEAASDDVERERLQAELAAREERVKGQQENTARLFEAGVTAWAGADAGWGYVQYGDGLLHELALLQRVGLTPEQALTAATTTVADRLGHPNLGRVAPGAAADLVAVKGDPLAGMGALQSRSLVMARGVVRSC